MINNKKISRKSFVKKILLSVSFPVTYLWLEGSKKKNLLEKKTRIVIPNNLQNEITFLDKIIIKKEGNNITAFSSHCTHLGCKINSAVDNNLVCPCHGSKFNFNGVPLNGPATKPLTKLEIVEDKSTGEMVVYV